MQTKKCTSQCDYDSILCQIKALFSGDSFSGYSQAIPGTVALGSQGVVTDTAISGCQGASSSITTLITSVIEINSFMNNTMNSANNTLNNFLFGDLYDHGD